MSSYNNYKNSYPEAVKNTNITTENYEHTKPIQNPNDFVNYLKNYKIVVVKAWASWCQPCKLFGEKLEEIAKNIYTQIPNNNDIVFLSDNIENEDSIFLKQVNVVPTFFVYFQGKLVKVHTSLEFNQLIQDINQLLNNLYTNNTPIQRTLQY